MADKINPTGNSGLSANLLPKFFQTPANKKFLQSTLDQLFQPGSVKKVSGFVGRENSKAATTNDLFIESADTVRQNYQLEPGLTIKDHFGNVTFYKDYIDYINQVHIFGGNTDNHSRLNAQEFYSWDPHIDWDKFVNFQNYYWMPYGPDVINIRGQGIAIASTYTVDLVLAGNNDAFLFTPNGLSYNPILKLYKGHTYTFEINSPGNPFSFKTTRSPGAANRYISSGIDNYGVENGTITFTVPEDAPNVLFYQSESDVNVSGVIELYSITDATYLDVEMEILGKKTYTLANGTSLSNGMQLSFSGKVSPESYATGNYYVEGVGSAIKLVPASVLEIISPYTIAEDIQFDNLPFDMSPFDGATGFAAVTDYITVNRASIDHNPWSRYNRWIHKDVITASAVYNGNTVSLDQNYRATRPIIEFHADLKLFNLGSVAIADIDLIDDYTTDVFSIIEGSVGYNIDGINLVSGHRVLFTADTDPLVTNRVFQVEFNTINGVNQIHLVEQESPVLNNITLIKNGKKNQSMMYWYDGASWRKGQQKTAVNQPPLFDVVDDQGVSYGDISTYNGTTFAGTTVFTYKVGTGTNDTVMGFPLTYKNVSNIGDIVFNFTLATDTFQYKQSAAVITTDINVGYLVGHDYAGNTTYINGWQKSSVSNSQAAVRIYNDSKTNNFDVDIFDDIQDLADLDVRVYINGIRLHSSAWTLVRGVVYYQVVLDTDIAATDILTIRAFATQAINSAGHYEIPANLQNNPLNDIIQDFTLGEVSDHVNSILDNTPGFVGIFPGAGNIRDLGNITPRGTKFVQHSGPLSLAIYHTTSETNNIVSAIERSREDYNSFKRVFVSTSETLGIDAAPEVMVDLVLQKMNANKPNTSPYYFSDMVPYGAKIITELTVADYRTKTYPLSSVFTLLGLSNKAVGVYLNGQQLVHGRDYTFNSQGYITIIAQISNGDTIATYEYDNTDGCFMPATPTKLGLWPKYEPMLYLDSTLVVPRWMIQGHDGSQMLAYGTYGDNGVADYRDALLIELETRIFNNVKVEYDPSIFDISEIIPGYNRPTGYSLEEFNRVLAPNFYKWTGLVGVDFTKSLSYDRTNPFTFNYGENSAPDGTAVPAYWRGIYRWMLDTDRPHLCPWEMLGFTEQPTWWATVYGPYPWTNDNKVMWNDLANGVVRQPGVPAIKLAKFVRPILLSHIPVDDQGNLISPLNSGMVSGITRQSVNNNFVFGDISPVENAWRRSSYYPFSVLIASMLLTPAKTFGLALDRSRVVRNLAGQLVYADTKLRIKPSDIVLPSIQSSSERVQTAGIVNYLVDYIMNFVFSNNVSSYNNYLNDLRVLTPQLSHRLGAFANKDQFNLLLESKTPSSSGNVFVPKEDFSVFLNTSSSLKKLTYSGVVITKLSTGFEIKGYSNTEPYFKYYNFVQSGSTLNVGGISASFTKWTVGSYYVAGEIVQSENNFYSVKVSHTASDLTAEFYSKLPALPIVGGVNVTMRTAWDRKHTSVAPYGITFRTAQEVYDFIIGYSEYLKDQGFIFNNFNTAINAVTNWETSAKEFLFWTTQNWSAGNEKWSDWIPDVAVGYGTIVKYNGDYYSAAFNIPPSDVFEEDKYDLLDGLSNEGNSVISLSPSAKGVTFNTNLTVVDDIGNPFNKYEIFKVDGTPIKPADLNSYREGNTVYYTTSNGDGIYNASFYLLQNEHVITINNSTIFNDTIYHPATGYRQERLKVSGYVTTGWYGGLDIPGFVFDSAVVDSWKPWQDHTTGDIVNHQGFYYSANGFTAGSAEFDPLQWTRLAERPTSKILPNWTNLATQFTDFYDLDSDSFNAGHQSVAQHLIGYQKRQYLENIIQDEVSEFKFFQGMIREKGTQNVLNKLFNPLASDNEDSLTFYEEWALRVGQYGATDSFDNIEIVLDEGKFRNNPQGIVLNQNYDPKLSTFIIQQTSNDVYLKPTGYTAKPFPAISNFTPFLRSAGYVNPNDVSLSLGYLSEIVSQDASVLEYGNYVWCSFEAPPTNWNVYKLVNTLATVESVTNEDEVLTLTTAEEVPFDTGDYIKLSGVEIISGFYKVDTITDGGTVINISKSITGFPAVFTSQDDVEIGYFVSQRVTSIDELNNTSDSAPGELLWTDNNGNGVWSVWEYNPIYTSASLLNVDVREPYQYGSILAMNTTASLSAINNLIGEVVVREKIGISMPWVTRQTIQVPFLAHEELSGDVNEDNKVPAAIAFSPDNLWMAVGLPLASHVSTSASNGYYTPVSDSGTNSVLSHQGVVTIYRKDINNVFTFVDTIVSSSPTASEEFGSSLAFADNKLFIGAPGSDKVYTMVYSTVTHATVSYNPVGSANAQIVVSSTVGITEGMIVQGTGFTANQRVVEVVDSKTLVLSGSPSETPSDILTFVTTQWQYNASTYLGSNNFGKELLISSNQQTIAIMNDSAIYLYGPSNTTSFQTISGTSAAISSTGAYLAVSSGVAVTVYKMGTSQYASYQVLDGKHLDNDGNFGSRMSFMNDYATLIVYNKGVDGGLVQSYDRYFTKWVHSEDVKSTSITDPAYGFAVGTNQLLLTDVRIIRNEAGEEIDRFQTGSLIAVSKKPNTSAWQVVHEQLPVADVSKVKKIFLYDKELGKLIKYIDIVDPVQGKIPGIADEEIKYKTYYDPATYSTGSGENVTINSNSFWSKDQVGTTWWDLRTAKFLNSYFDDAVYRTNTWNTLATGASIDVYEWVESKVLPSAWDEQADTPTGLASGYSGTSLYGNASYSVRQRYDTVSKALKNTYYFWVKNKNTVPSVSSRHISAQQVANLIGNPRGQGYSYLSLTGIDSFSLTNVQQHLKDTDVVLSIEYWLGKKVDQNIHSQWKLISTDSSMEIPDTIEQKWFDSLCGADSQGRSVPDTKQPAKLRYGIENRPRQSMFVNRVEALKEFIETVNRTMLTVQVAETYNITDLEKYDTMPSTVTGLYDIVVDTALELSLINASSYKSPSVRPVVSADGKIVDVEIISSGKGYVYAPVIDVHGEGIGAKIATILDTSGQIIGVTIADGGEGYIQSSTVCTVRSYSALVKSDSQANGGWGVYSYDASSGLWSRILTQAYDVRNFWDYTDWFATGYGQFSSPDYAVSTFAELNSITPAVGELVKVLVANKGGWALLHKYADSASVDWTQSYTIVGVQNGTIQFSKNLYSFDATAVGYDASTYDDNVYDIVAATELRIILNTLKTSVFIGTLKVAYLNLFLASVRYAHSEQVYIDWAFKTSFVRATHLVGDLDQPVTYPIDNLANFEDYIAEVKPYRTQIREYISNYVKLDSSPSAVTDFDLQPVYENNQVNTIDTFLQDGQVVVYNPAIQNYPWKFWSDNVGFKITELRLVDGGSGYVDAPEVTIDSVSGAGATAKAYVANGRVNRIVLKTPGDKYLTAPSIVFTGGLANGGVSAKAIAVIGDGVVRSNLIKMKFDRLTQAYYITDLSQDETINSALVTGTRKQFSLTWGPDIRVGQASVTVNGVPVLRDTYKLAIVKSSKLGYTSYSGSITFDVAPAEGAVVVVTYVKDISLLNAADRIQYYYNPTTGELGKDLAQLMTGIDYGGVQVSGLGFEISGGWGNRPYGAEGWDVYDKTFTDFIVTTAANQHSFTLNYIPAADTELNFYHTPVGGTATRLDDPDYGTPEQTNADAIMLPTVADGNTTVFAIPNTFAIASGDVIVIRQSTSDGSVKPQDTDYDTIVSGGDLAYSSALGIAPEDIIVDGDGFVTPTSSPAPEEVVPGQVVDAVAIKVFDRPSSGNANVKIDNYFADGISATFKITQRLSSKQSVIVKKESVILTLIDDYTVNYNTGEVTLVNVPVVDTLVSIFSVGFSGENILDIDYFVGDGTTTEFITHAPQVTAFTSLIYLDGESANTTTFITNGTYDLANVIGIRFPVAPAVGQLINYIIVDGNQQTYSVTRTERIAATGALTYELQYPIGKALLNESNMIVRVDQTILRAPNSTYHTVSGNRLTYFVDQSKVQANTVQSLDVIVVAGSDKLALGIDFTVDISGLSIKINRSVYKKYSGKQLSINVISDAEYTYDATTGEITFKNVYTSENVIDVFSSYVHDTLDIQRTEVTAINTLDLTPNTSEFYQYKGMFGGKVSLDRTVKDDNYIWVTHNGKLLTPSIDYKLLDDRQSIQLLATVGDNDVFGLMTFGNNVLPAGIAYMQFKDMLNRVTYRRLNANKQTRLVRDLYYSDTSIEVDDASVFGKPNIAANRPGVIEIRGERIEYFDITGNVISKLRRGTMGTGTPNRHKAKSYVQDIGGAETIPYFDKEVIESVEANGTTVIPLTTIMPMADVIASGDAYTTVADWEYLAGFETTIPSTNIQADDIEVFAGGIRLRKKPYLLHSVALGPDSPSADEQHDADYTVDGTTGAIHLTTAIATGVPIVVVKRTGVAWDSVINILYDDTKVARFLKEQPGTWYTDARQVAEGELPYTFDSIIATFDSDINTFDRGN